MEGGFGNFTHSVRPLSRPWPLRRGGGGPLANAATAIRPSPAAFVDLSYRVKPLDHIDQLALLLAEPPKKEERLVAPPGITYTEHPFGAGFTLVPLKVLNKRARKAV
jgi:hypothetical protein